MKSKIIFFLCLLICLDIFSQDLNIILDKEIKKVEVLNDSIIYQEFYLKEQTSNTKLKHYFNEEGKLFTKITLPSLKSESELKLVYKSFKNDNYPKILEKEKVKNILHYPKDFKNIKIKEIRNLLMKTKNIYVIESDSLFGFYVFKKVFLSK